jgi:nitrous oxide reductase accessory protein NosL
LRRSVLILSLLGLLAGCSDEPQTGPAKITWDRDACERCRMVLSDRSYAAQIRVPPGEDRKWGKVYKFDDIGCAVLWMDQQPWKEGPAIEIWVTDHRDGQWLDARAAHYVTGKTTPMEYGLGAQREPAPGTLSFEQAIAHVYEVEKRFSAEGQVNIPVPIETSDR